MDNMENTLKIAQKLYFQADETALDHLFTRVARTAAIAERVWNQDPYIEKITYEKFYDALSNFEIVPNTPCFANANPVVAERMVECSKGNLKYEDFTDEDKHALLSACFVLPLEDSLDSIMEMNSLAAKLHKLKAGTGFCFSRLRPEKWPIKYRGENPVEAYKENLKLADNAKLCSSGPVSFLEHVFDSTTSAIKEGGGRRGANMCTFSVSHPDIFKLLDAKNDLDRITNFNLSILIPNAFMDAVKDDLNWDLVWKEQTVETVKARAIWDKIVYQAWKNGEPGLLFVNTANDKNPLVPVLGDIDASNPCGEVLLYAYGSCNLSAINLKKCLLETQTGWEFDWAKLERLARLNLRFLDNVIEVNCFPDKRLFDENRKLRAAGSGFMGLAEMLSYLAISYDSQIARDFVNEIMAFVHEIQTDESIQLAKVRGVYPYGKLINDPRRNWTCSVIAPNGTTGLFASTNGGIEPFYGLSIYHSTADMTIVNTTVKEIGYKQGWWSQDIEDSVLKEGSLANSSVDQKIKDVFKIANEISPTDHVKMLGTCATHIDNSISKTINLPSTASEKNVEEAFMLAFELGCKGITVYRDGCRANVLNVGKKKDCECGPFEKRDAIKRPKSLDCEIHRVSVKGDKWVVIVGLLNSDPYEIFVGDDDKVELPKTAKTGTMTKRGRGNYILTSDDKSVEVKSFKNEASENALTRIISTALRHGTHVRFIVDQLEKTEEEINSFSKAVARVLKKYIKDGESITGVNCPDCGKTTLVRLSGCPVCTLCGYSRCL